MTSRSARFITRGRRCRAAFAIAVMVAAFTTATSAQDPPPESTTPPESVIDARAVEVLKDMSRTLEVAERVSFRASMIEEAFDEETGRVMHLFSERTIALQRPDRLRVEERSAFARHTLWFAGGTLTVHDALSQQYGQEAVAGTVDDLITHLQKTYDASMPAADLISSRPHDVLSRGVVVGEYVGESMVGGQSCHHLSFRHDFGVDWQIWIDTTSTPLPRRLIVSYREEPGHPQCSITFRDWNLTPSFEASTFQPSIPEDAERVTIAAMAGIEPNTPETGETP